MHKLLSLFLPILLSPAVKADYYEGKRECVGNGSAYVSNARFGWCEHAFMRRKRRRRRAGPSFRLAGDCRHHDIIWENEASPFTAKGFFAKPLAAFFQGQLAKSILFPFGFLSLLSRSLKGSHRRGRGHLGKLDE